MTDFTEQELELAQWLEKKVDESIGDYKMSPYKFHQAWLLTARELQKKQREEFINYLTQLRDNIDASPVISRLIMKIIDGEISELKSHFLDKSFNAIGGNGKYRYEKDVVQAQEASVASEDDSRSDAKSETPPASVPPKGVKSREGGDLTER